MLVLVVLSVVLSCLISFECTLEECFVLRMPKQADSVPCRASLTPWAGCLDHMHLNHVEACAALTHVCFSSTIINCWKNRPLPSTLSLDLPTPPSSPPSQLTYSPPLLHPSIHRNQFRATLVTLDLLPCSTLCRSGTTMKPRTSLFCAAPDKATAPPGQP